MKKTLLILLAFSIYSCSNRKWDGEWGATVTNNDEFTTIYYSVQQELMKSYKVYDKDFAGQNLRRDQIKKTNNGHSVESWFITLSENGDTTINKFSCEVIYDQERIGYVVKDLVIKETNANPK